MVMVALRVPRAPGVKPMVKLQTTVGGTSAPQVVNSVKSAASVPVRVTFEMLTSFEPATRVTICPFAGDLTTTLPKSREIGKTWSPAGVAGEIFETKAVVLK